MNEPTLEQTMRAIESDLKSNGLAYLTRRLAETTAELADAKLTLSNVNAVANSLKDSYTKVSHELTAANAIIEANKATSETVEQLEAENQRLAEQLDILEADVSMRDNTIKTLRDTVRKMKVRVTPPKTPGKERTASKKAED